MPCSILRWVNRKDGRDASCEFETSLRLAPVGNKLYCAKYFWEAHLPHKLLAASKRNREAMSKPARRFLVCIHDATPAYTLETQTILRDLTPLVGDRFSFAVVPNWYGRWPLTAYPDYCRLIRESSAELLLHGYFHRRQRGWGATTFLASGSDEMNGFSAQETERALERGQSVFTNVFGEPARGFVAPAWQRGRVRVENVASLGFEHVLGFFSIESRANQRIPLATWSWDCGRWSWLGHVGHGIGWLLQSLNHRVPALAIHPKDLRRGFWTKILRVTEQLREAGHEPSTLAQLVEAV
jgi:hypothetical protein